MASLLNNSTYAWWTDKYAIDRWTNEGGAVYASKSIDYEPNPEYLMLGKSEAIVAIPSAYLTCAGEKSL
jgi:hypothetical protein